MSDKQIVIRQSKKRQWSFVLMTGLMILWYFVGPYEKTRITYIQSPTFTIIIGIVIFGAFLNYLNEIIKRKAEIILTKEGIELRDKGFFEWDMIESFSTLYYRHSDDYKVDLVLHFKEFADLKFDISHLEKNKEEISDLITQCKESSTLFFVGHLSD